MNNNQDYQTQQVKREQILQQIILEQKQKIRELEAQEQNLPLKTQNELQQKSVQIKELKQALLESNQQLEDTKALIKTILQQKEQLQQEVNLLHEEAELKKTMEIQAIQKQYQAKLHQLESENALLQQEVQQSKPLGKANNNYTQEETYIEQIQVLQQFLSGWQKQYLAEIVHYKRAAEVSRQNSELLSHRFHEDRKQLQKQLEELQKLDEKIQDDVVLKLQSVFESFTKFNENLKKFQLPQTQLYEKLEQLIKLGNEQEACWTKEKQILIGHIKTKEAVQQELETCESEQLKEEELSILKQEVEQLKDTLESFKQVAQMRETKLKKEVERLKIKLDVQIQKQQNREVQFEEELQRIGRNVSQLESNYDRREKLFTFDQEKLQECLDKFRGICDQIAAELKNRKNTDQLRECKDLIQKLNLKKCSKHTIKGIEKLEILLRDFQKSNQRSLTEELRSLLQEIFLEIKSINENAQSNQQREINSFVEELEALIQSPNKKVDSLLSRFHKELLTLTQIREQTFKKPELEVYLPQTISKEEFDSKELESCEQLRQFEKELFKKELCIAVEKSQKLIIIYEKKLTNLENQLKKNNQQTSKKIESLEKGIEALTAELKASKQQLVKQSKLTNDIQTQRLNDRKEFVQMLKDSEERQLTLIGTTIKQFEQKCETVLDVLNKKLKSYQQKHRLMEPKQQEKTDEQNVEQLLGELKMYQSKEKEKEEYFQSQIAKLSKVLEELQQNISNLHSEKGQLMEQLETMNNLLQTQKKLYYSFRQQ